MSAFPFPKLLAFLESEADKVEFMKVCAEAGIGPADMELAKLLLAFQLYKAFYARIPREIKGVHKAALEEFRGFRDEFKFLADRTASDAVKIEEWDGQIRATIAAIQPKAVAEALHKRLVEETLASIGGTVQALAAAYDRIDKATAKLNAASACAEAGIYQWQVISLRRVWASAFIVCAVLPCFVILLVWFVFIKH